MTKLKTAERIYEPDEATTHYGPPFGLDQVTLCGVPDWLGGRTPGEPTNRIVNCLSCLQIVKHVKATRFD
jgi:hypothetical protein